MKKFFYGASAALTAGLISVFALSINTFSDNTINEGVYADGLSLGGMTKEQAENAVSEYVKNSEDNTITLYTVNDNEVTVPLSELGLHWSNTDLVDKAYSVGRTGNVVERYKAKKDLERASESFEIEYNLDDELVKQILTEKCSIYDVEAVNGSIERVDGEFVVSGGVTGQMLDIEASAAKLEHFINEEWDGGDTSFRLSVVTDNPNGTVEELSLVKDVLGAYHTSYSTSSASRSANIKNGASLINGSVIFPGEEFSFYNHVKPFTFDNGYQIAAAYSSGQVVDSIGGGICQVSSTLYNSVLLSELEVTERRNHGMIVTYVDPARDATIAESAGTDFRFINNTDAPIYIDAYTTSEKQLYITIYGHETRPDTRELTYESEVVSKTVPENVVITQDAGQPVGYISSQSAHIGYKANLWKIVTENGETSRELVNTSTYNASPRYVTVGVATADPNIQAAMANAIATGDVDTIKATASQCKALSDAAEIQAAQLQAAEAAIVAEEALN